MRNMRKRKKWKLCIISLRPLACCDRGFASHRGHGYSFVV